LQSADSAASIDELAGQYVRRIRELRPTGPYHLFGWSLGGLAAHAAARLLGDAGLDVGLLVILDAYPHDPRAATLEPAEAGLSAETAERLGRLTARHTYQRFNGDLLFFTAAAGREPGWPAASAWRPYVSGSIDNHDLPCGHFDMMEPDVLTSIAAVVAGRLAERATC
jgi:enterobactin synthetase component F